MSVRGRERAVAYGALCALLVGFVVQGAVEARSGEPYPSFHMPTFGGAGELYGVPVSVMTPAIAVVTAQGERRPLPASVLFGKVPAHIRGVMLRRLYGPNRWSAGAPAPRPRADKLAGRALKVARDGDRGLAHRTVQWLRSRTDRVLPGTPVDYVEVTWVERAYRGLRGEAPRTVFVGRLPVQGRSR